MTESAPGESFQHHVGLVEVPLSEGVGTSIPGVRLLETRRFSDDRGWFVEGWNQDTASAAGIGLHFAQHNLSWSRPGTLRGLHFQHPPAEQAKLVAVAEGEIFDVVVDIRPASASFGRWFGCVLSAVNNRRLFIPTGCAHGFLVLSGPAMVSYMCSVPHQAAAEGAIRWNDPALAIEWPFQPSLLSPRDRSAPLLRDILPDHTGDS